MIDSLADALGTSRNEAWIVLVLVVVQLCVQIAALIDLARRPADLVMSGRKWVWLLVILFGNLLGAIVYFATGRVSAPAEDPTVTPGAPAATDRAKAAADLLYGNEEKR